MTQWSARRWLAAFRSTGGMAWRHGLGVAMAFRVQGHSLDEQQAARDMIGDIADGPLRYDAIRLQVAWSG